MHRFRFGVQISLDPATDPLGRARTAEAVGYDVVTVADHVGIRGMSPMPVLAAIAAVTQTIRLGTFVLNVEMRNPVQLAWEASSLDQLSNGRFELGLGAGHTPQEFAACGIPFDAAATRKERLREQVEVIRALLDGDTVTRAGTSSITDAAVPRSVQDRLPILVGGNGAALLAHAGRHADIVGLQGLGRTLADGQRHDVNWSLDHLDRQVEQIRAGAGERFADLELNALVQVVEVTDDTDSAVADLCERIPALDPADVAELPYVLIGSVDEIAAKLHRVRERWGISYFVVRALEDFTPVVAVCND